MVLAIVLTSGTKGGSSIPASNRLKFMLLKKGCLFTSAVPSPWHPSRCFTSLARSWNTPRAMVSMSEKQELHKDIFTSCWFWTCPEGSTEGICNCCYLMAKVKWIRSALFYRLVKPFQNYLLWSVCSQNRDGCFCLLSVNTFKKRSGLP